MFLSLFPCRAGVLGRYGQRALDQVLVFGRGFGVVDGGGDGVLDLFSPAPLAGWVGRRRWSADLGQERVSGPRPGVRLRSTPTCAAPLDVADGAITGRGTIISV